MKDVGFDHRISMISRSTSDRRSVVIDEFFRSKRMEYSIDSGSFVDAPPHPLLEMSNGLGFRVWGLGSGVWGLGVRVWGLGF